MRESKRRTARECATHLESSTKPTSPRASRISVPKAARITWAPIEGTAELGISILTALALMNTLRSFEQTSVRPLFLAHHRQRPETEEKEELQHDTLQPTGYTPIDLHLKRTGCCRLLAGHLWEDTVPPEFPRQEVLAGSQVALVSCATILSTIHSFIDPCPKKTRTSRLPALHAQEGRGRGVRNLVAHDMLIELIVGSK